MLSGLLAHQGRLQGPHDLWGAWSIEATVVLPLAIAACLYTRGAMRRRVTGAARTLAFLGGIGALIIALVSPLDALSSELASAHMVQHVLLILVAAPLLTSSMAMPVLVSGAPDVARRAVRATWPRAHRALRSSSGGPWVAAVWLAHAGALWFWHASGPYDAAVLDDGLHALEHAMLLGTGILLWTVIVRRRGPRALSHGQSALVVFTMALQSVFLAVLLTFATTPWYGYDETERWWGLAPLADQHLAGAIMWVPASFVYVGAGLALVVAWLRASDGASGDDWGPTQPARRITTPSR